MVNTTFDAIEPASLEAYIGPERRASRCPGRLALVPCARLGPRNLCEAVFQGEVLLCVWRPRCQ